MVIGFGLLVFIAGLLDFVGWHGLSSISINVELNCQGTECLETFYTCTSFRKEFALRGFETYGDDTITAAEKWQQSYDERARELVDRCLVHQPFFIS